ncbi:MAG: acylphosphatase [Bacteroidia bacterium]|nr:acylphosphatase [Bacteroidia bacterium]
MQRERWRLRIYGKVQGVFFRKHAQMTAQALGLSGFVQNMLDGSVLAEIEGEVENLERFTAWAHTGPPAAKVQKVEVEKGLPLLEESSFSIKG